MTGIIIFLIIAIIVLTVVKGQLKANLQLEKVTDMLRVVAGVGILLTV